MRTEEHLVTAEMARDLMIRNLRNRPMRPGHVRDFERELRSGRASTTHQGIAVDVDGNLQDGQHRLQAIINTGIPWKLMITYDCPVENFNRIDMGTRRSTADMLDIRGIKNATFVAAVGQLAWQWERGTTSFSGLANDEQLFDLTSRYPGLLAIERPKTRIRTHGVSPALMGFFAYMSVNDEFVDTLLDDCGEMNNSATMLLETYASWEKRRGQRIKRMQVGVFVLARNDFEVGKLPSRKYQLRDKDPFPNPNWGPPIPFDVRRAEFDDEDEE